MPPTDDFLKSDGTVRKFSRQIVTIRQNGTRADYTCPIDQINDSALRNRIIQGEKNVKVKFVPMSDRRALEVTPA